MALLICDWRIDNLLDMSGLVFTEAYCKLPIRPLSNRRSFSVTGSWSMVFLFVSMLIAGIFRT